jgi:tellurium resistance protein TerZ
MAQLQPNLKQNETFTLDSNFTLSSLQLGLSWDFMEGKAVDLDASAVCFDAFGHLIDAVFYNQLLSADEAIRHSGDNKTGKGR